MFRHNKSQMAVIDLFIALFIATILIAVVIFSWNRYTTTLIEKREYEGMQILAFQTTDLLVKSGGEPENWEENPDSAYSIGLASSDRNISVQKLDALLNISSGNASRLLGLDFYDFYFQLKNINGTRLVDYGTNSNQNKSIVNIQRLVLYKNEKSIIEFALWK